MKRLYIFWPFKWCWHGQKYDIICKVWKSHGKAACMLWNCEVLCKAYSPPALSVCLVLPNETSHFCKEFIWLSKWGKSQNLRDCDMIATEDEENMAQQPASWGKRTTGLCFYPGLLWEGTLLTDRRSQIPRQKLSSTFRNHKEGTAFYKSSAKAGQWVSWTPNLLFCL